MPGFNSPFEGSCHRPKLNNTGIVTEFGKMKL
jgi:hypothetical protein